MDNLRIISPKRNKRLQTGWEGFFPYYAGYPESFATELIKSADLAPGSVVLDPWNGSGTTTYTAARLGMAPVGQDINPAMITVARARMLPPSEADSLEPLGRSILRSAKCRHVDVETDPLRAWFDTETSATLRSIEMAIRSKLLGPQQLTAAGTQLDRMSSISSAYYVALFSVARSLASAFKSSNPTWMKKAGSEEAKLHFSRAEVYSRFAAQVTAMAVALAQRSHFNEIANSVIRMADSASSGLAPKSVDLVLTSPPYCTRIDYTSATRVELAILDGITRLSTAELSSKMIGSIRVPTHSIEPSPLWGNTCAEFLESVRSHPAKASAGYYYKTHLDYFEKMSRSLNEMAVVVKSSAFAVLVVQDSYYKDVHNDLPTIISEMASASGFNLVRREDFSVRHSMASINPHSRRYGRGRPTTESVICLQRAA